MNKTIRNILAGAGAAIVLVLGLVLAPITRHVSTTGNDQNTGAAASPFRTIAHCVAVSNINDICEVAAGTYNERPNIKAGTIALCAVKHTCIIKGATLESNGTLDGFYSVDNPSNDGGIVGNGSGYVIKNNKVSGSCMVGIKLNGTNGLAEFNEVFRSKQCAGSSGPDADGFRFFGTGHIIRGNYIHDIRFVDSSGSPHIDCWQTYQANTSNILIEGNICDNYDAKIGENNGTQGANLENCSGIKFVNNYFHVYGKGILWESTCSGSADNNIFVSGPKITGSSSGQYCLFGDGTSTGNICYLYSSGNTLVGGAHGTGNVNTDPRMSGYCSLQFPSKGVPCGGIVTPVPSTVTASKTATGSPIPVTATRTITPSPSKTKSPVPATLTPTGTFTVSPTPKIATVSQIPSLENDFTPTFTEIATYTPTPTKTPVLTPSITPTPRPVNRCDFNADGRVTLSEWFRCWFSR